jgi:hypothetical protein
MSAPMVRACTSALLYMLSLVPSDGRLNLWQRLKTPFQKLPLLRTPTYSPSTVLYFGLLSPRPFTCDLQQSFGRGGNQQPRSLLAEVRVFLKQPCIPHPPSTAPFPLALSRLGTSHVHTVLVMNCP